LRDEVKTHSIPPVTLPWCDQPIRMTHKRLKSEEQSTVKEDSPSNQMPSMRGKAEVVVSTLEINRRSSRRYPWRAIAIRGILTIKTRILE